MTPATMGAAYAASRGRRRAQLEYDQCNDPILDKKLENKKFDKYNHFIDTSPILQKYVNWILAKKIVYPTLKGIVMIIYIILLAVGFSKDHDPLIISGLVLFLFSLAILTFPAIFAFNNVIIMRQYKGKLCFAYLTCFKRKVYFNDELIQTAKRDGISRVKVGNLKIEIYSSSYTYWIKFNKEKPNRKRFGQFY